MKKFFRYIVVVSLSVLLNAPQTIAKDNTEVYKSELMMRGYEFTNNGLSEAIIKNDKEAIELFVNADININLTDNEGLNALERAMQTDNKEMVLLLSSAGGSVKHDVLPIDKNDLNKNLNNKPQKVTEPQQNETQEIKTNPLCDAVNTDNLDLTAKLAKNSPYLNNLTEEGLAPIHYAIFNNNPSMVHLLLNAGADVNMLTDDGLTPLDIAVLNNQKIIAKELLENGGALSINVARELIKFGCKTVYDEDFGLYDANFDDIFETMSKIQSQVENNN